MERSGESTHTLRQLLEMADLNVCNEVYALSQRRKSAKERLSRGTAVSPRCSRMRKRG